MTPSEIRILREKLNLTQEELAERIGVSLRTIQNYEAGGIIPKAKVSLFEKLTRNLNNINNQNIIDSSINGHIINIGENVDFKKIIKAKEIEITRQHTSHQAAQRLINDLNSKIETLERLLESKNELIDSLNKTIGSKEEVIAAKDALIDILRKK